MLCVAAGRELSYVADSALINETLGRSFLIAFQCLFEPVLLH